MKDRQLIDQSNHLSTYPYKERKNSSSRIHIFDSKTGKKLYEKSKDLERYIFEI